MASTSGISTVTIIPIVIIIIAIINTVVVSAVHEGELQAVFSVLRSRGYRLFANAIATSDIHYDLKTDGNFTLFAPINSALFSIDMTMSASNYVSTLRYHVVPRRLSISDLVNLPPDQNSVPSLVTGQDIVFEQRQGLITAGGVNIVVPGMFYGRDIAVHGLEGILDYRPHTRNSTVIGASLSNLSGNLTLESPITEITGNYTSPAPPVSNSTGNNTFQFPVDMPSHRFSDLTQNQTVTNYPDTPPIAHEIAMDLVPNPKRSLIDSASLDLTPEEHIFRLNLLELNSEHLYDLPLDPISYRLQQFTPVNDKTLDCSVADNDWPNAGMHARKLHIPSDTICAQK